MPDTRVGSLDNPQRYGCRSVAVYENSTGYYYKLSGCREKVHGNQLWTLSMGNVKMRGSAPLDDAGVWLHGNDWEEGSDWEDEEERQLAAAIAASLQDERPGWDDVPMDVEPAAADAAAVGDGAGHAAGDSPGASGPSGASRECTICLTEPSVMLMRPCNHVCACQTCARRLVRHPCPLCRRTVTKCERVYF